MQNGLKSLRPTDGVKTITLANDNVLNTASQVMLFPMPDTGWVVGLATPESRIVGLAKVMMQDVLEVLIPIMTLLLVGSWLVVRRLISRLDDTRQALDDIAQEKAILPVGWMFVAKTRFRLSPRRLTCSSIKSRPF